MANTHSVVQASNMALRAGEGTRTPNLSDRERRAMRRRIGIPVSTSPTPQIVAQGKRHPKHRIDSDSEFEEDTSSEEYTTSDEADSTTDDHLVPSQRRGAARANPEHSSNMVLLQDSKFSADRTDMRLWHELRYVRSLWSREEQDQLLKDCLAVTDEAELQSVSNSVLWTAAFDRYGVPLSDIFTYGLRPHPGNLRFSRKKCLSPLFCDLLTTIMVHPVFQGDAQTLRYILQLVVRMRVDIHTPPMGSMPDMDDSKYDQIKFLADTLLLEEETPESRLIAHADAYLFISQQHGARFHPDIVILEDLLSVSFSNEDYASTAPRDDAPHSACLFYVQLWDLRFLIGVLNGLSVRSRYLPAERYKTWWLKDTYKIQQYISEKLDSLIQQWFLSDERNYRIRQKLKKQGSGTRLYDIPEEDFSPTYARSQYVTQQMRAVFEGDYLEAICPPDPPEGPAVEIPPDSGDSTFRASSAKTLVAENLPNREQELGVDTAVPPPPRAPNSTHSYHDSPARSIEKEDSRDALEVPAQDKQRPSPIIEMKAEAQSDSDDRTGYQSLEDGEAYNEHSEEHSDEKDRERSRRQASFVSVQSLESDATVSDYQHDPYASAAQGQFARRGLPRSERH
ncbi:hypothetical protein KVR01_008357 [Diaporthe batatas]|uniref:uncharacterized protein n=1 Tax=Diaporthe batatas TaxID=748121 RepID=UPI001D044845|nr:uncharacterized protein KVR01_008357 [Diaporthe batatas]KAG8162592.1 hypothetical protein KVR01_008357 [Diaporthe batatas]